MDRESNIKTGEKTGAPVADFVRDRLKQLTGPETEKYLAVSASFREEMEKYSKKSVAAGKESNISLFLFESLNTTSNLLKLMKENMEEQPDPEHMKALDNLTSEVPPLFGLNASPAKINALELVTGLLKKKPPPDLTPHFMFSELVVATLEDNRDKLYDFFKSISGLLMNLWETSRHLLQEVNRIAGSDGEPDNFIPRFDIKERIAQAIGFEQSLKESEHVLLESVHKTIRDKQQGIQDKSLAVPESIRKNRQIYNLKNLRHSLEKITAQFKQLVRNFHNTFFVLSDDWMLELEISHLKYYILKQHFDFYGFAENRFLDPMHERTGKLKEMVDELMELFETGVDQKPAFRTADIEKKRTEIKRKLVLRMMPGIKKITLESDIPAKIDEFEHNTAKQFRQLSEVRTIKENTKYDEPTEAKDLDKISPLSLVSFQMMPQFMQRFPLLKQAFIRHLQTVQNKIEEIPEIIDYSLTSASSFYEEKKEAEEAVKIGLEGVKRASNKIDDLDSLMDDFFREKTVELKTGIEKLAEDLTEITNNESALQIKMRIARARAVEKSKEFRNKIFNYIKDILPRIWRVIRKGYGFLRESSIRISKQFIFEDKKSFIATDVSDYLTETEQAINRLPFIYQRLFKTEPLSSFELFTERKEEIEKLNKAYSRWNAGKFAPTAIIAEKGWGKTSLVNRFHKMKLTHEEVIHITPEPETSPEDLFNLLMEKIPPEDSGQKDGETSRNKQIVVLDGLEKLFEARINGFDHLRKLLQHISDTNHFVFWITTCHIHAWDYLEKTIEISDYFGHHIRLTDMTDEMLMKTIERRHNISGYRLMFLPEAQKKSLISFKKQSTFEEQEDLKKQYFTRMHKIVKGNLSQAFLFWMRSTAEVTEDSVYIEYISSEFFNFLGSMTDPKLMILKNIVIHNGITAQKHAGLFRIETDKSKLLLQQLYDDGIIVKSGNVYNINPIIYRQVIDHLYLLNILH